MDDPETTFITFCHSDFVSLSHQFEFFFQSPVLFTQMMNHFVVEILRIQEKPKIFKASFYSIYQIVHSESIIWLPEIQSVKCTLGSRYRAATLENKCILVLKTFTWSSPPWPSGPVMQLTRLSVSSSSFSSWTSAKCSWISIREDQPKK